MGMTQDIAKAKNILDEGGVIGLPTETVYGLAARIDIPSAIEKIFKTKERPFFDPLIVHVSSMAQAQKVAAYWGPVTEILAQAFWPGPLTLVLPKGSSVNPMITSGLESVGIRMPAHPVALEILNKVGTPLAAPSANKFGKTSPTSAAHVRTEFGKEDVFVVNGGDCNIGIESTVLSVKENGREAVLSILRKGHILRSDLEKVLNTKNISYQFVETTDKKESPGHMKHHYMPPVPFIVCKDSKRPLASILQEVNQQLAKLPDEIESIKIVKPKEGLKTITALKLDNDPVLASREFYAKLREAAAAGSDGILFYQESFHDGERWEPLFDRLNKAASLILN
ncbi:translation factor related to Sua5 [Bdellovibrio bacteriovorus]|uniref:Threonylcarbamoyl-AMP synthase n=1 Tax=Bdellovibrio bacteriovorus TaxID=959 RepID=A0A150WRQ7_BDEBC|nr:L-threonylcarbamoyladenylate synthase [Bdellovibrio bacteriovorus]KYG67014.1 translation factor related to Sua5 [Bdellovibrio bacteriovorus]